MQIIRNNWFFLLCVCLSWAILPYSPKVSWNVDAIMNGAYWRIFTGNIAHSNLQHFLMNIGSLWVICLIAKQLLSQVQLGLISCIICLSGGLSLFLSQYDDYVGLSGLIHGLLAAIMICEFCYGAKRFAYLLLIGLSGKLLYEQYYGAEAWIEQTIGVAVAVDAHLYYAIIGSLTAAGYCYLRKTVINPR